MKVLSFILDDKRNLKAHENNNDTFKGDRATNYKRRRGRGTFDKALAIMGGVELCNGSQRSNNILLSI